MFRKLLNKIYKAPKVYRGSTEELHQLFNPLININRSPIYGYSSLTEKVSSFKSLMTGLHF